MIDMGDANKILTVSYGTFSCTLEGFDEPFSAMKAIAEYFRDLAAEDRYFGAEPPTPDAEALHRITEAAIHRRIEARFTENSLVMRPDDSVSPDEPMAATALLRGSETVMPESVLPDAGMHDAEETTVEETTVAEELDAAEADAAPQDADDSAPPMEAEPEAAPAPDAAAEELAAADTADATGFDEEGIVAATLDATEDTPTDAPDIDVADAAVATADDLQDSIAAAMAEGFAPDIAAADETPDHDALTGVDEAATADEGDAGSDKTQMAEPADASIPEGADTLIAMAAAMAAANAAAELGGSDSDRDVDEQAAEPPADVAPDAFFNANADTLAAWTPEETEMLFGEASAIAGDSVAARLARIRAATLAEEADEIEDQDAAITEPAAATQDLPDAGRSDDALSDDAELSGALQATPATSDDGDQPAVDTAFEGAEDTIAAVTAMLDAEAVDEGAAPEAPRNEDEQDNVATKDAAASLPPDAEAALQAELAAIAAASLSTEADDATPERMPTERDPVDTPERAAPGTSTGRDTDMDRLFDATDSRLSNAETSRRRANIEHLKAAVAARAADQKLAEAEGTLSEPQDQTTEYREDLARVMRPSRVRVNVRRRQSPRPAPLVLVSEQRVDADQAETPTQPVRPRRVSAADTRAPRPVTPEPIESAQPDAAAPALTLSSTGDTMPPVETVAAQLDAAESDMSRDAAAPAPENTPPMPRKMSNSLAFLAERAGMAMSGVTRRMAPRPAPAEDAVMAPPAADIPPAPEAQDAQPQPAPQAAETAETAPPQPEPAQPEPAQPEPAPAPAPAEQAQSESADLPDFMIGFIQQLEASDATEIEDVVALGARYITHDLGEATFRHRQLIRMVRIATEDSIRRDEAAAAIGQLTREGILVEDTPGVLALAPDQGAQRNA